MTDFTESDAENRGRAIAKLSGAWPAGIHRRRFTSVERRLAVPDRMPAHLGELLDAAARENA